MVTSAVAVRFGPVGSILLVGLVGVACDDPGSRLATGPASPNTSCSIPISEIFDGGPGKDGIPALTNPRMVGVGEAGTEYLQDDDRVIGLIVEGQPIAVPHNIGWWHEIVNLDLGTQQLAITYCPLTGSSLVFDRSEIGGAELGVSGLLFQNNLIMYDRTSQESLWPQMMRSARCGPRDGLQIGMFAAAEMTWAGWRTLHPNTRVVEDDPRDGRNYRLYPYGAYEDLNNGRTLFPMPRIDGRRPPKERVLGIPVGERGGIAFPFGQLDRGEAIVVIPAKPDHRDVVVFWDRERRAAVAHEPRVGGLTLTLLVRDGTIVDLETGSTWRVDGVAMAGALAGERLQPVAEAFVAFWFAWAAFYPDADLWEIGG